MYIINDICYADEMQEEIKVKTANYHDSYPYEDMEEADVVSYGANWRDGGIL